MRISDWSSDVCSSDLRVAVDHPTYHNALGAISRNSCQPVPISLPEAGWDLDAMDAAFRQAGPRFAYLLPDFHNPTGRLMDEPTRRELVTLAARTRTPLLIDETMVETGLAATAPAPVAVHDRSEEHTSELQSLMRISYAVFCLTKTQKTTPVLNILQ